MSGIGLASGFGRTSAQPLDLSFIAADATARDGINSGIRYEGMLVYVTALAKMFQLVGGIANTNWKVAGGSGGGGGGALQWIEDSGAPITYVENANRIHEFEAGVGQTLYTLFKVPAGYSSGDPISLKMLWYSVGTTGNVNFKTLSTLVKPGTDAITSTTNQRTSTNSAVTLSGGTVSIPQAILFDLTDTTGKINSIAVSAGDLVLIALTRATDTATVSAKTLSYAAEIS